MSERVRRHLSTLRRVRRMNERDRREFVRRCDGQLVDCMCECAKNVLKGRVPLSQRQLKKLRQWKKSLRILSTKRPSLKAKKKLLQSGGFLGALLTPVLSFLGGLVSQAAAQ
jgi:hypothetical protein